MGTKGTRSSGSQFNPKGVTQGNTLVDPNTGKPIDVITDGEGVRRLAVDADVNIGDIAVDTRPLDASTDNVGIKDTNTGAKLKINPDGSIDSNVVLDSASGDNVMAVGTEDGTTSGIRHVQKIGSDGNLRVKDEDVKAKLDDLLTELEQKTEPSDTQQVAGTVSISGTVPVTGPLTDAELRASPVEVEVTSIPLPADAATETTLAQVAQSVDEVENKLDDLLTELQQKTEPANAQNIRALDSGTDSVAVPGVATAGKQDEAKAVLESIDSKLTNPLPVSVPGGVTIGDLNAAKDDVAIAGTEDGTATGTVRHFVNNRRQQILAAHDRVQAITYADFGTKDQRITQIIYTSPTFPGIQAIKAISYTLVGNRYRRDNITWSVV